MTVEPESPVREQLASVLSGAAGRIERNLDGSLGAIKGISFAEYRLLSALAVRPNANASRVDLAHDVGLTASGVTRALKPLEKMGVVSTTKSPRDARMALATLTTSGKALLDDADAVVTDAMHLLLNRSQTSAPELAQLVDFLDRLGR